MFCRFSIRPQDGSPKVNRFFIFPAEFYRKKVFDCAANQNLVISVFGVFRIYLRKLLKNKIPFLNSLFLFYPDSGKNLPRGREPQLCLGVLRRQTKLCVFNSGCTE